MTYDDFDFATRLFSDIGLDQMAAWAEQLLSPVASRPQLMEGLAAYFEHDLNINQAAEMLGIHHNSLRYRLSRAEQLLRLDLHAPSAVASVFLALTARDLASGTRTPSRGAGRRGRGSHDVTEVEAPQAATGVPAHRRRPGVGVALGPDG